MPAILLRLRGSPASLFDSYFASPAAIGRASSFFGWQDFQQAGSLEKVGKYAPLGAFLRRWKRKNIDAATVELTFADVERIIGAILPRGATSREWWCNAPGNERGFNQCLAWLNAGFEAHPVDGAEQVLFRRTDLP